MSVKPLSKAAEQRILRAAEDTVELVAGGYTPTDAVVKAATQWDLPAGHSRLVARAYNVARTNQQRESGSTILEKTADFPLADGDAAEAKRFPSTQAKEASTEFSIDYLLAPTFLADAAPTYAAPVFDKAAYVVNIPPRAACYNEKQVAGREQRVKREFEDARAKVAAAQDRLAWAFDGLVSLFKTANTAVYADTVDHAAMLQDSEAIVALGLIRKSLPEQVKSASTTSAFHHTQQQQYIVLQEIKQASRHWAATIDVLVEKMAALPERLPRREAAAMCRESVLGPLTKVAAGFASGLLSSLGGSAVGSHVQISPAQSLSGAVDRLQNPEHELQLKNIRSQAMLHMLMNHDPVIKGYAPEEVLGAFSDISTTAPRLTDQVLIMQPLLRKRLAQGALDPFEVSQLMSMDRQQASGIMPQPAGGNSVL